MTVAPEYSELHRLVDRLTPRQVQALRVLAMELVGEEPAAPEAVDGPPVLRDFPWIGMGHGGPDLAERSEEILRAELGRDTNT